MGSTLNKVHYGIMWTGIGFNRTRKIEVLPTRAQYLATSPATALLCLAKLLDEDDLALQFWEAL